MILMKTTATTYRCEIVEVTVTAVVVADTREAAGREARHALREEMQNFLLDDTQDMLSKGRAAHQRSAS